MSLLLIALPPGPPAGYEFATSTDGQALAAHGSAAPALLPAAGRGVEVVAMVPADELCAEELLRRSDNALYRAKEHGRNRVETV